MTSEELRKLKCPKCGKEMSHGYLAGHWIRIRWVNKAGTKTIFAGETLRKKINWLNSPNLEATRCETCKLGLFRYDY